MTDRVIKPDGSPGGPEDMHPPAELQTPLHTSIADELIAITPERWSKIKLVLVRKPVPTESNLDDEGVSHVISSLEGHSEVVWPSVKLFERTHELDLLFQRHGARWRTVEYVVTTEDDSWSWDVAFTYEKGGGGP